MGGSPKLAMVLLVPGLVVLAQDPREAAVGAVLDDWHLAAAQADETRYFAHLREGAVFLGTDATERWTKAEFQRWAHPFFKRGKAWAFKAAKRNLSFAPDGKTVWFDEELATPNLGPARGSGLLICEQGAWRIAQYNLSVPIPNALMDKIKVQIETHLNQASVK